METETPTPTATLEPTLTLTPTNTPTPTPNFYVEMTAEPSGLPARVGREMSIADYSVILLLVAILVSLWAMYIIDRLRGGR